LVGKPKGKRKGKGRIKICKFMFFTKLSEIKIEFSKAI
jgi:hypothetical protein